MGRMPPCCRARRFVDLGQVRWGVWVGVMRVSSWLGREWAARRRQGRISTVIARPGRAVVRQTAIWSRMRTWYPFWSDRDLHLAWRAWASWVPVVSGSAKPRPERRRFCENRCWLTHLMRCASIEPLGTACRCSAAMLWVSHGGLGVTSHLVASDVVTCGSAACSSRASVEFRRDAVMLRAPLRSI